MTEFPRLIGMVHLPPLPGSPLNTLSLDACLQFAVSDAQALAKGGADGLIIENFGDVPFRPGRVDGYTVAMMTRVGLAIRDKVEIPIGVNVLRNDSRSALAIAFAIGASFVRVNVHSGTMATDQGLITGEADILMRLRRVLGAEHIKVFADVLVKHATPLAPISIRGAVEDATLRGLADAVIVSGSATGKPASVDDVAEAAAASQGTPVYVGSGVTAESIGGLMPPAFGVIVGSSIKRDANVSAPVDPERVRMIVASIEAITS